MKFFFRIFLFHYLNILLSCFIFFQEANASISKVEQKKTASEIIGEQPEENSHQLFLRESSVLLKQGEVEVETGFHYENNEENILGTRITNRLLTFPLSVRVGLFDRCDAFFNVPLSYGHSEVGTTVKNNFGFGDISAGLHGILLTEGNKKPEIVVSLSFTAPTGQNQYENTIALGSGHWSISTGILFVKSFDPIVVFVGANYTHRFEESFSVGTVQLGEDVGFTTGLGFAINQNITLSTILDGRFITENQLNGSLVDGTFAENISLTTSVTYVISRKVYLEPSVTVGLNDSASDVGIGLSIVKRF